MKLHKILKIRNKSGFINSILHFSIMIILLNCFIMPVLSQQSSIKKFTHDTAIFINEVNLLLSPQIIKEINFNGSVFMVDFRKDWTEGVYTISQQEEMYQILDYMVEQKFQTRAYVSYFLSSQLLKHKTQDVQEWNIWHKSLKYISQNLKHDAFSSYLTFSETLLLKNIFSSFKRNDWITSDSNYKFRFDTIPYIELGKTDIYIVYNKDTVKLHQTNCQYYPLIYVLQGYGGTIYWDRQKISHEKVWAELPSYQLETLTQDIIFKDVKFYNKEFFSNYLIGTLQDKAYNNEPSYNYPQFKSNDINLKINNLYDNFNFRGGFRMDGVNIYGYGTLKNPADLYTRINKKNDISIKSTEFAFSPEYITSDKVSFRIKCDEDSLYHPEMMMTFNNNTQDITLMKSSGTMGEMSISNSYHKVDINCDALFWNLKSNEIDITSAIGLKKKAPAWFTSFNYFRSEDYRKLRGLDKENPLEVIVGLSNVLGRKYISFAEIAFEMKITEIQARLLMAELCKKDFLFFDYANQGVVLRDKATLFPLSYMRKIDYDNLIFKSEETKTNAKLILDTMDMYIYNIKRIWLSDSQQVGVMTYSDNIVLHKNRDFSFRGFIGAGSFDFFTDSSVYSYFSYQDFSINLPSISSLKFWVDDPDNPVYNGKRKQLPITSFIEYIGGKLYIDDPNNKSGLKKYDRYSYFEATTNEKSAVYYNKAYAPEKYPKDKFKFKVLPFIINDLQHASVENMNIAGVLQSSGIIPDFETSLTIRPDFSLGFNVLSPTSGFNMYSGKGTFFGTLDLSNHGLYADGRLNFLSSTSITDESEIWDKNSFVFFPDSSIATLQSFNIQEVRTGVEYPMVTGSNIDQVWYPNTSLMVLKNIDEPFSIFKQKLQFSGDFRLSSTGLIGLGDIQLTQMSIVSSKEFSFKSTSFSSPNADITLLSMDLKTKVFNAYKYGFSMDMEKLYGDFKVRNDSSYINFPQNNFIATKYDFGLDIKDSLTIHMSAKPLENHYQSLKDLDFFELINQYNTDQIEGPLVTSTNLHHNGFNFISYKTTFSVLPNQHKIDFYEIPLIKVADSYIIPNEGHIEVYDHPDTIYVTNSELMIQNDSIHHYIYDADINILGQDEYLSKKGTYDYITPTDTIPVLLNDISIDNYKKSVAKGFISDSLNFKPNPYFDYYGDVKLTGESPYMQFFGYLKINDDDCDSISSTWIAIDTIIDANKPVIPISAKTFNDENKVTFTGLAHGFNEDFYTFYNELFGQIRNKRNDDTIFTVDGLMVYDEFFNEYRIGRQLVLDNPTEPYNLWRYNPKTCTTIGNGFINLHPKFAQKDIDLKTYGSYYYDQSTENIAFDLTTELVIPMSKKIMEQIVNVLSHSRYPTGVEIHKPFMKKYLNYKLGYEHCTDFISKYQNANFIIPKEFKNTFLFSHIPFKWKQSIYTYYYSGEVELTLAHNKIINKKIPVTIAYSKHRTGNRDMLHIYFEADDYNKFYIYFSDRGKAYLWTSNEEIKVLLENQKEDSKQDKQKSLNFNWIDESACIRFLDEVETFDYE